jgi:hypothetical protein
MSNGAVKKFFLILAIFLFLTPFFVSAADPQTDQEADFLAIAQNLIEVSLKIHNLLNEINDYLNSKSPLLEENLSQYLRKLFQANGIFLSKDDFLQETDYPYLSFAKILNLVPPSAKPFQRISERQAKIISKRFSSLKGKILLDGLYGKIDAHEHYRTGGNIEEFLKAAGLFGVSKVLFVPTGFGPDNKGYKLYQKFLIGYIAKLYPEKIIPFCTIDEQDPQAPQVLEECLKAGGKGLKLLGGHPSFYDEPLDSEKMYKVYNVAKKYKVPVLVHGSIINIPQLKKELKKVYADFPEITFIHAHYCSSIMKGINLDQCAELLDKYPNLYIDLSMGGGIKRYHRYLREDLEKIKKFVVKYQDRILFGSDIILDKSSRKNSDWIYRRIKCDIDLHEKKQYRCDFGEKDKLHQGFDLSKEILRKLYFKNPKRALGL